MSDAKCPDCWKSAVVTSTVDRLQKQLKLLADRGYGDRDRLFRKMVEEFGEYAEAIEYYNGSTRKKKKLGGLDPVAKLREEVADMLMITLALAKVEGMDIVRACDMAASKLEQRTKEHNERK